MDLGESLEGWMGVTQLEQQEEYDAEKSLEELRPWTLHCLGVKSEKSMGKIY